MKVLEQSPKLLKAPVIHSLENSVHRKDPISTNSCCDKSSVSDKTLSPTIRRPSCYAVDLGIESGNKLKEDASSKYDSESCFQSLPGNAVCFEEKLSLDSAMEVSEEMKFSVERSLDTLTTLSSGDSSEENFCPFCDQLFNDNLMIQHIECYKRSNNNTDTFNHSYGKREVSLSSTSGALKKIFKRSSKTNATSSRTLQFFTVTDNEVSQKPQIFKCPCCSLYCLTKYVLQEHIADKHASEEVYYCNICDFPFCGEDSLEYHQEKCIKEDFEKKASQTCAYCDFSSSDQDRFKRHVNHHKKEKYFPCKICKDVFSTRKDLRSHLVDHRQYMCCICEKVVKSKRGLFFHMQSHSAVKPHPCIICNRRLSSLEALKRHMNTHDQNFPRKYKCPHCHRAFKTNGTLKKHILLVHQRSLNLQHSCRFCRKSFTLERYLLLHLVATHENELSEDDFEKVSQLKKFKCDICDFYSYNRNRWENHKVTHSGKYPYICSKCNRGFIRRYALRGHFKVVHGTEKFTCEKCLRTYVSKKAYDEHIYLHESGGGYICEICNKLYETQGNLDKHMQSHSDDMPYSCIKCDRSFRTAAALTCHKRSHQNPNRQERSTSHSGVKPKWMHSCNICSRTFKYSSNLNAHKLCHHGESSEYKCPTCGKVLKSERLLSFHLRTHSEEKPLKCNYCKKRFNWPGNLNTHVVMSHTKQYKGICHVCKKGYATEADLRAHLKLSHKMMKVGGHPKPESEQNANNKNSVSDSSVSEVNQNSAEEVTLTTLQLDGTNIIELTRPQQIVEVVGNTLLIIENA